MRIFYAEMADPENSIPSGPLVSIRCWRLIARASGDEMDSSCEEDWLDRRQHADARSLDPHLLVVEPQDDQGNDHVCPLQGFDGFRIGGKTVTPSVGAPDLRAPRRLRFVRCPARAAELARRLTAYTCNEHAGCARCASVDMWASRRCRSDRDTAMR